MPHKIFLRIFLFLLATFIDFSAFSQKITTPVTRTILNLNKNWAFEKGTATIIPDFKSAKMVTIPHTWNAEDAMDDEPGYYRGAGWYAKKLVLKPEWKDKKIFLYFEAANQEAVVFLNGKEAGRHIGGYTAFQIQLRNLKFDGSDVITVMVDNSHNESIAPLTADFTFFGGIYRNVSLLVLNKTHFDDSVYASAGVFVHAEKVSNQSAEIVIKGSLVNEGPTKKLQVVSSLTDATGQKIAEVKSIVDANANTKINFNQPIFVVKNPKLWSPETPYLYEAKTRLIDPATGKTVDVVANKVGLRYFNFDANKGFFLNGKPCKLIGASRHQDYAGRGNAVSTKLQVKDVMLIKDMGGNFLRVAHYPQDQAIMDACDRLGILTSVEIPIVNEISETEEFAQNCKTMQLEMIKQNYNHPSVIIWAYMNEVLLKMKFRNDLPRKQKYLDNIAALAQSLEELTRKTDPTRYTMMSNHGDVNGYTNAGLVKIPMLIGWNLYQGWYGGKSEDFGPNLDKIHQQMPDKPILVTEYGADADPRIHSFTPIKFDKSLEYAMDYHQIYIRDILKRPFVVGAAVWNLADFASETRDETMPHVNNKGLLTLDRKPKNTYYLYKANFSQQPFLKIGDGSWELRSGIAVSNSSSLHQNLQVISNATEVTLFVNGKKMGTKQQVERVSNWEVPFVNGTNTIIATALVKGVKLEDKATIDFKIIPNQLNVAAIPFKSINIAMGTQRQYIDPQNNEVWLPSKPYETGSWGSVGGEAFKIKNSSRQSYGTDKNIKGTENDPIYQTQLVGIEKYKLDLPKGKYEVTMHFAELMGNGIQTALPYNLDTTVTTKEIVQQRIFDIYLNDKLVVKDLNIAASYGVAKSLQKRFECMVTDDKGIVLRFESSQGKPILNALQVKKID